MGWWQRYPRGTGSAPTPPPDGRRPALTIGTVVRLVGKPDRVRVIHAAEWHRHRRRYVYIVETSAPNGFTPYWFADQLTVLRPTPEQPA